MADRVSRRRVLQGVAASGVVSLAGCTNTIGGGGGGSTIRLGITQPLSGAYASVGENNIASVRTTVELWSEEAGVEIETFERDTEADPTTGSRAARELIQEEDVHLLTGSYSSAVALAINQVAQQQGVPYITTPGSQAFSGADCTRYGFGSNPTTNATTRAIATYAMENLGNSFYTMTHNYTAGTEGTAKAEQVIDDGGGSIEGNSLIDLGQSDMSSAVTSAIDSGADIMLTNVFAGDLATLLSQAREFGGFNEMTICCSSIDLESIYPLGPDTIQGLYGTPQGWWTQENERFQNEFLPAFEERLDRKPGMGAPNIYASLYTAFNVMSELDSPSNSEQFVRNLEGKEWDIKTYGENRGGQYFRECDHRCPLPIPVAEAKSPDEARNQYDLLGTTQYIPPGEAFASCQEAGCQMPDY
jgi:ABC-type branched-subunit amino acid transport system substrate-binding protein